MDKTLRAKQLIFKGRLSRALQPLHNRRGVTMFGWAMMIFAGVMVFTLMAGYVRASLLGMCDLVEIKANTAMLDNQTQM